jgi:hypothetical protein
MANVSDWGIKAKLTRMGWEPIFVFADIDKDTVAWQMRGASPGNIVTASGMTLVDVNAGLAALSSLGWAVSSLTPAEEQAVDAMMSPLVQAVRSWVGANDLVAMVNFAVSAKAIPSSWFLPTP